MAKQKALGAKAEAKDERKESDIPYSELDKFHKMLRDFAALELRKTGLTWPVIATHLRYLDKNGQPMPDTPRLNVERMLRGVKRETTEEFLELQTQRYELIFQTGIRRFLETPKGGERAAAIALKALDRLNFVQGVSMEAIAAARTSRSRNASTGALMPREAYSAYSSAEDLENADEILEAEYKELIDGEDLEGLEELI